MNKFKLVQTRYNGSLTKVIEVNVVDTFKSEELAVDYLTKRGYKFDVVTQSYICGNAVQSPISIEKEQYGPFDIRSFEKY